MPIYPANLLCLGLMLPVFGLTALIATMLLVAAGPSDAWSVFSNAMTVFAFFGAGLVEPLRYGWRIVALLAFIGLALSAGAIPSLRIPAFYVVALLGTLGVAFCLFFAWREGVQEMLSALLVLSPSIVGIVACVWCANKFKA